MLYYVSAFESRACNFSRIIEYQNKTKLKEKTKKNPISRLDWFLNCLLALWQLYIYAMYAIFVYIIDRWDSQNFVDSILGPHLMLRMKISVFDQER